jgi:hypothetical protein
LCRAYFNAPLPDYLCEAYKHTFTDEDRDLFYKHLTGFDFAAQRDNSAVPVHFRNIKHIKNPILKLRYLVEVVFQGKEFMISKYIESKEQRAKSKDGKKGEVSSSELRVKRKFRVQSYEFRVKSQPSELHTPYSELNFGGCGILIVGGLPSANGRQVRAIFSGKW